MKCKILLLISIAFGGMCSCESTNEITTQRTTHTVVIPTSTELPVLNSVSTDATLENSEEFVEYQAFLEDGWLAECWDKAMTQVDMTLCAGQQTQQSESILNQFLEEYEQILDDEARSKLQQVQILWEDYKQQDCQRILESYNGGTVGPMNRNLCLDMHNRQRLENLLAERMAD